MLFNEKEFLQGFLFFIFYKKVTLLCNKDNPKYSKDSPCYLLSLHSFNLKFVLRLRISAKEKKQLYKA